MIFVACFGTVNAMILVVESFKPYLNVKSWSKLVCLLAKRNNDQKYLNIVSRL
jgi:hypothetical protein